MVVDRAPVGGLPSTYGADYPVWRLASGEATSVLGGEGVGMRYQTPEVTDFGSIVDHTFTTPGGVKGCTVDCHLDMFNEQSALAASP